MRFETELIDRLADHILAQQSFRYGSFPEAKMNLDFKEDPSILFTFDRLSLCVYSHNLDDETYSLLCNLLRKKFELRHTREDCKSRQEYSILLQFMTVCPEYAYMNIIKQVRPDFLLSGTNAIGIEVTEFTTSRDSVLHAISKQNFGQGKSADEIKEDAIARHGKKANKYDYYDLDTSAAIGSRTFDTKAKKNIYVEEVLKKYRLYKEMFTDFDEFMILCDAQYTICVTDKKDSDDIVDIMQQMQPNVRGFTLCILREDSNNIPVVDRYEF